MLDQQSYSRSEVDPYIGARNVFGVLNIDIREQDI